MKLLEISSELKQRYAKKADVDANRLERDAEQAFKASNTLKGKGTDTDTERKLRNRMKGLKHAKMSEGASVPYTVVVAKKIEEYITINAVTADEAREIAEREGYEVIRVEDTGNGAM